MNEEQQSLFLLQLPSDLNFDQMMNPNNAEVSSSSSSAQESANSASTEHQAPKVLPNGKLGKLRLYKSGKVKLVTENGNEYDVNAGLAACFLQCLMSVEVPPPDDDDVIHVKAEGGEATSSSSVNKKTNNKTKDNVLVGKEGKLCFLGNVTKKLVVTPDYELGIRRKKQVTSAPSNTNLTTHVKEEIHEGTTDDMVMDEDDGGDMYDDDT